MTWHPTGGLRLTLAAAPTAQARMCQTAGHRRRMTANLSTAAVLLHTVAAAPRAGTAAAVAVQRRGKRLLRRRRHGQTNRTERATGTRRWTTVRTPGAAARCKNKNRSAAQASRPPLAQHSARARARSSSSVCSSCARGHAVTQRLGLRCRRYCNSRLLPPPPPRRARAALAHPPPRGAPAPSPWTPGCCVARARARQTNTPVSSQSRMPPGCPFPAVEQRTCASRSSSRRRSAAARRPAAAVASARLHSG